MTKARHDARWWLVFVAVLTVGLWQVPHGRQLLYPFTLLATYAHEMGHGITALIIGADFQALEMNADGSGLARWSGAVGRIGRALIAAGGLVGPSLAGALVLALSRLPARARGVLFALGGFMVLSGVLWVRNAFGLLFIGAFSVALFVLGRYVGERAAPLVVQLLGVQLCLSVFRDVRYMFSDSAVVGGVLQISDSAAIAEALLLPYWFWGAVVAVLSFSVLAGGAYVAFRGPPRRPKKPAVLS